MNIKKILLILSFTSMSAISTMALAQESEQAAEEEAIVPAAYISEPIYNEIEYGLGYIADDAYRFGRYSGLESEGLFLIADIEARDYYPDGRFWSLRGTRLGLESSFLDFKSGDQGVYNIFLTYQGIPNYIDDTVNTPFENAGSDILTLPAGFDITTNLDANLKQFERETKRDRFTVGSRLTPAERWKFDFDFTHEKKEGVDVIGAAIANGSTQVVGNTTFALLPEPIDQETYEFNAAMNYGGKDGQLKLAYHMSLFNNNLDTLTWQDPFNPATGVGSLSLEPENEFHQLSITGGYNLSLRNRLTGVLSIGRMTQDDDFNPYTVNSALTTTALPVDSLDAEVLLKSAQLKLTSRPANKWRLTAELRYDERDNKTDVNTYSHVVMDSFVSVDAENRPYSYKNNRLNLTANYRFNSLSSLKGGYKYDEMKRDYTDAEREKTEQDTLFLKWKVKPRSTVDVALYTEISDRDGSEYNTAPNVNPSLRKYFLADRERTRVGASVDFQATEKLYLSVQADYNKDDYINSEVGLTEAIQPVYSLDFSYQPRSNVSTYGYYTIEDIESSQTGFDVSPSPTGEWLADFEDNIDTLGIGIKVTDLGQWQVGADLVYSQATGKINLTDINNPGTEFQFPDVTTDLMSLKLWASFQHSKEFAYKVSYWYEDYSVDNYVIDDYEAAYDVTSVENALLLGNETLDYDVHAILLSAVYQFE